MNQGDKIRNPPIACVAEAGIFVSPSKNLLTHEDEIG